MKRSWSLWEKTALLVLLDLWDAGTNWAWDDAREILADAGLSHYPGTLRSPEPIAACLQRQFTFDPDGRHMKSLRQFLCRQGLLRVRGDEIRVTTLARGLRADEVAGRL